MRTHSLTLAATLSHSSTAELRMQQTAVLALTYCGVGRETIARAPWDVAARAAIGDAILRFVSSDAERGALEMLSARAISQVRH